MPQPPITPFLSRQLVRTIPFAAQFTARNAAFANAATQVAAFDIALHVTDPNSFLVGANPSADPTVVAIGPNLDVLVFSVGGGTLLVEFAVDATCAYRQISNSVVPASTATNVSGLRITGRFCRVTFTATAGPALLEFGAYVRSA